MSISRQYITVMQTGDSEVALGSGEFKKEENPILAELYLHMETWLEEKGVFVHHGPQPETYFTEDDDVEAQ